jgi:hypothetical protein
MPEACGWLSQEDPTRQRCPAAAFFLLPPLPRRLQSNLSPTLWRQSLTPRGAAVQPAGPDEFPCRSERRGLILNDLTAGDPDDQPCKLVRVAGAFGMFGHVASYMMLD